jgi:hypothetical protein
MALGGKQILGDAGWLAPAGREVPAAGADDKPADPLPV